MLGAISQAGLSDSVQALLSPALLEDTLCVPPDARHKYQVRVVDNVGKILSEAETSLQTSVKERQTEVKVVEEEKARQDSQTADAEARKAQRHNVTQEKKRLLAAVTANFRNAKAAVQAAQEAQARGDSEVNTQRKKEASLQNLLEETIKPIIELGADASGMGIEALVKQLSQYALNGSMLTALPGALTKKPGDRGKFDLVVVNEVVEEVNKCLATLQATIADAASANSSLEASTQSAHDTFQVERRELLGAAEAFNAAQAEEGLEDESLQRINFSSKSLLSQQQKSKKALGVASALLTRFRSGALAAFLELREGASHKDSEETPAEVQVEGIAGIASTTLSTPLAVAVTA